MIAPPGRADENASQATTPRAGQATRLICPANVLCADLGEPRQGAGQPAGIDLPVVLLVGRGAGRQFGLDRGQQPHFGRDLGGQFREGHGWVIPIQVDGGRRGGPPLQGAFCAVDTGFRLPPLPIAGLVASQHERT
jgi:hypothetical protein